MNMASRYLLLFWLIFTFATPAVGKEKENEVNYLDLAALMMRDGNLDRALLALQQVDLADEKLDRLRYYSLLGITYSRLQKFEPAREALQQATKLPSAGDTVFIYLAQAEYQLGNYSAAIDALDHVGAAATQLPSLHHLKAQSYWLMGRKDMALASLDVATRLFPNESSFLRRKVFYLIDLGLFQTAPALGRESLEESEGKLEDYVALGNAMRSSGELDQAAALLERALLRFPSSPEVSKVLAHVYIDRGELSAAADLLYGAALLEPELMAEAAELYRRSGQIYRALAINGTLNDQPEKLRQRLALLIEMQSYEQAAAMDNAMYRIGLLNDEDLAYAMAYAQFKSGEFERSEQLLTTLTRPELVRKAVELRRAMLDCQQVSWKCM